MNKALFLDRDGVINKNFGHVHRIKNFKFRKGIFELVKIFQKNDYLIFVVTNQAGIGKGLYSEDEFNNLNKWMIDKFAKKHLKITKTFYCPHKPDDNCECRKPRAGLIFKAASEFNVDLSKSFLIGDKESDLIAARVAKIGYKYKVKNSLLHLIRNFTVQYKF